jgi:5-methylcytosine-specific restriction endonuclease McrA
VTGAELVLGAVIGLWLAARRRRRLPARPPRDPRRYASPHQRTALWRRQRGLCALCGRSLRGTVPEAHHVTPWALGGRTVLSNMVLLHPLCHDQITTADAGRYGWRD